MVAQARLCIGRVSTALVSVEGGEEVEVEVETSFEDANDALTESAVAEDELSVDEGEGEEDDVEAHRLAAISMISLARFSCCRRA
jgi:copper chaperone CopZ